MTFPRAHQRVKWLSKYDGTTWFRGTVIAVFDDRATIRGDSDNKVLTLPTYRLSVIEPGWKPYEPPSTVA